MMSPPYRGERDLKVYQRSYALALEIFQISRSFPPEEKYSFTDQIRRSSRSVPANIAEAWRKRKYEKAFVSKLVDSLSESTEVEAWLDFCKDLACIDATNHQYLFEKNEAVQKMLNTMVGQPEKFCH